jgi:hypothetical protein
MRLDQSFRECKQNEEKITTKNSKAFNTAWKLLCKQLASKSKTCKRLDQIFKRHKHKEKRIVIKNFEASKHVRIIADN